LHLEDSRDPGSRWEKVGEIRITDKKSRVYKKSSSKTFREVESELNWRFSSLAAKGFFVKGGRRCSGGEWNGGVERKS